MSSSIPPMMSSSPPPLDSNDLEDTDDSREILDNLSDDSEDELDPDVCELSRKLDKFPHSAIISKPKDLQDTKENTNGDSEKQPDQSESSTGDRGDQFTKFEDSNMNPVLDENVERGKTFNVIEKEQELETHLNCVSTAEADVSGLESGLKDAKVGSSPEIIFDGSFEKQNLEGSPGDESCLSSKNDIQEQSANHEENVSNETFQIATASEEQDNTEMGGIRSEKELENVQNVGGWNFTLKDNVETGIDGKIVCDNDTGLAERDSKIFSSTDYDTVNDDFAEFTSQESVESKAEALADFNLSSVAKEKNENCDNNFKIRPEEKETLNINIASDSLQSEDDEVAKFASPSPFDERVDNQILSGPSTNIEVQNSNADPFDSKEIEKEDEGLKSNDVDDDDDFADFADFQAAPATESVGGFDTAFPDTAFTKEDSSWPTTATEPEMNLPKNDFIDNLLHQLKPQSKQVLTSIFPNDSNEQIPEVKNSHLQLNLDSDRLWTALNDIESSVPFVWTKSVSNEKWMQVLNIDPRNNVFDDLISSRKPISTDYIPSFALSLNSSGIMQPTKVSSSVSDSQEKANCGSSVISEVKTSSEVEEFLKRIPCLDFMQSQVLSYPTSHS